MGLAWVEASVGSAAFEGQRSALRMTPVGGSELRCDRCGRGEWRTLAWAEQREVWEALDHTEPSSRQELQDLFVLAALLCLLEVRDPYPAIVTMRAVAVQAARAEQTVNEALSRLESRGWVEVVERGNDAGERHGDPEVGYRGTRWRLGEATSLPGKEQLTEGRRAARVAWERDWVEGLIEERVADWDEADGEVLPGQLGGSVDEEVQAELEAIPVYAEEDEIPYVLANRLPDKPACHDRWDAVPPPLMDQGRVTLARESPVFNKSGIYIGRERDRASCPAAGTGWADYLTWSDAFLHQEAGVLGWWLARQQIGGFASTRSVPSPGWLQPVSGSDVADICGVSRQAGLQALQRLHDRGFANRLESGRYALLFHEQFWNGHLDRHETADRLLARHARDLKLRNERARRRSGTARPTEGPEEDPFP